MMTEEGYIKFKCRREDDFPGMPQNALQQLTEWRAVLKKEQLIGEYPNKIGFGNISVRKEENEGFFITGSATGGIEMLGKEHYAEVTDYHFEKNEVVATGKIDASSESMSHAALYESNEEVKAVIHVHHLALWKKLLHHIPTTQGDVAYGTPEMAEEIKRLYRETDLPQRKILAMAGHEEGLISFGMSLQEAGEVLFQYYKKELSGRG